VPVFQAEPLDGEALVWKEPHRLDILYDSAGIEIFHNLWGSSEFEDNGQKGKRQYLVEIRLVPKSPDFSLLTSDGDFRPRP
jgi:hypothetical protein